MGVYEYSYLVATNIFSSALGFVKFGDATGNLVKGIKIYLNYDLTSVTMDHVKGRGDM